MNNPRYWFPAKTYGWGWGMPVTWQGWVVMVVFMGAMLAGGTYLLPRYGEAVFFAFTFVCNFSFCLVVCSPSFSPSHSHSPPPSR